MVFGDSRRIEKCLRVERRRRLVAAARADFLGFMRRAWHAAGAVDVCTREQPPSTPGPIIADRTEGDASCCQHSSSSSSSCGCSESSRSYTLGGLIHILLVGRGRRRAAPHHSGPQSASAGGARMRFIHLFLVGYFIAACSGVGARRCGRLGVLEPHRADLDRQSASWSLSVGASMLSVSSWQARLITEDHCPRRRERGCSSTVGAAGRASTRGDASSRAGRR